ncbi:hypothetical protein SERLA73DRAFT_185347 [Serpula lacrymans var. lacrymans S7.3]|uniref:Integral membrane protein S linking to the trans Golgi network-domain-containing protein n=2 Tax=Serpula lacrymans var. lacrymans TaxID=341189 RepID=F8Q4L3_SERL3|nr:uncharacterized protein SERLADRAFT_473784 [Serpula lacrymans var. lacrymans S7.9]EGN97068.1 hypothetical protein SERLA73DRAFT_185347 [Serpula lacrymans var. lacrymans S7.3]EGO22670.1 hypothetical protein SERLADRAFT_473784 [Serpula lacrymans var. lacrymans S7.9]
MAPRSSTSWDPVLLISQIVSMQTLHYLTLSLIIPPCLAMFAEKSLLIYEGGPANVGMVMDWREMAGLPTVPITPGQGRWNQYTGAWSMGKKVGSGWQEGQWDGTTDPKRGWTLAFCWMLASCADIYYLCFLIRRPRLILDFTLTLLFNHLVLTTYYSASIPTSFFFWLVMIASSALTIVIAEQLCVKREMTEGLVVSHPRDEDEVEMGELPRRD